VPVYSFISRLTSQCHSLRNLCLYDMFGTLYIMDEPPMATSDSDSFENADRVMLARSASNCDKASDRLLVNTTPYLLCHCERVIEANEYG
jgi:hypothetical protein